MRGKPFDGLCRCGGLRIIPAHAGQTTFLHTIALCFPDHPRACGANTFLISSLNCGNGSSPRMRGKHSNTVAEKHPIRIIPAHAGQTTVFDGLKSIDADHPRACGANGTLLISARPLGGSSPRMRGKPRGSGNAVHGRRIIPAHAGQTTSNYTAKMKAADHPRACGANRTLNNGSNVVNGSSPRMRGKPGHGQFSFRVERIIPAHAGQTPTCSASTCATTDHPRACGANRAPVVPSAARGGSSPRMRGKRGHAHGKGVRF